MRPQDDYEPDDEAAAAPAPVAPSRHERLIKRFFWLHSFGALSFGVGVMLFARKGLQYADKVLIVLGVSWFLVFVALRFIVGRANRAPDERLARKGVRLFTNYVIKQLYQQMFFFLVPLYASSATWSLASPNWPVVPLLLLCAVVSTMDLVFDNFIMERRLLASVMYGLALFGVLNLILPLVLPVKHFEALLIAAAATAPAVALLSFPVRSVVRPLGLLVTLTAAAGLVAGAWYGRRAVPPVPLAMADGAVGHGTRGSYECLPGSKPEMRSDQLDGLRCGSFLSEPGKRRDTIVHHWRHRGRTVASVIPTPLEDCGGWVVRSYFPQEHLPTDPSGVWTCVIETEDRQLVGIQRFQVRAAAGAAPAPHDAGAVEGDVPADAGTPPDPPALDAGAAELDASATELDGSEVL